MSELELEPELIRRIGIAGNYVLARHDMKGMPIVAWCEGDVVPNVCKADFDDSVPCFTLWTPDWWRRVGNLIVKASLLSGFVVSAFGMAVVYASNPDGGPYIVLFLGWLMYGVIASAVLAFPINFLLSWRDRRRVRRGHWGPGTYRNSEWLFLQSFSERDASLRAKDKGFLYAISAGFGSHDEPFDVSHYHWSDQMRLEIVRVLTREFIEKRAELLNRRQAASAALVAEARPSEL